MTTPKCNFLYSRAIYDKENKSFYLIRDRLGITPLYYFRHNETIAISSEINSIISVPFFKKRVNFKAVSSYLSFRYPTEDDEIFFNYYEMLKNKETPPNWFMRPEIATYLINRIKNGSPVFVE